jgi:hypothetical protein
MTRARQAAWKRASFCIESRIWGIVGSFGSVRGPWGISYCGRRGDVRCFQVHHLPSGQRVVRFDSLRVARRWCEGLVALGPENPIDHQLHRLAILLPGVPLDLLRFAGGVGDVAP